ncbi:glyoxylate/hydroxypyruvate reductase HPR3-like [Herrania umbratica]|uniref:Glyoxylate/hydroxypyruvate reductase HPR3-like n=1 Tax=Herrania umbratica TaxID=108875 RepID=A0A6J1A1E2_9ROSI|nr:glyoxylate/hydroxypyruvate reductase HPR3-like [Herrania umbratica]XP_021280621.1 glyoxylate/hydroxypyruvate reductase HPR3-like [Herrania umbratica]
MCAGRSPYIKPTTTSCQQSDANPRVSTRFTPNFAGLKPTTMAPENPSLPSENDLPYVLILKPPPSFVIFGEHFFNSTKFRFLKAYESPLPLAHFLLAHAQSVQAILSSGGAPVTADTIRLMPLLRLVVTTSQGLNHIDLSECRRRGIVVASAGTIYSADCADSVVALLIDVLRKVSAADRFVKQGLWSSQGEFPLGSKLGGKRVGIVGLGSIGSEVAKRLEAFGCSISYNSRKKKPFFSYPFYPNVRELAANCDALIICCALTDETHHLINKEVLSALGKDGVIINIARGPIIDEKELVRCLVEGEIRGAGLDVFEHEPDVPNELFALDNVVMSPHNAVFTWESFEDLRKLVVGNLEAFFSNEPLLTPVVLDDQPHFSG